MCEVIALFKGKEARAQQNGHIVANSFKALQAAERLQKEGFTLLKVAVDKCKPVVWVQACERCVPLNGNCYKREHRASGTIYTWSASYAGAFIKWQTTNPNRAA